MTSLYVLREPESGEIRYIGKTLQSLRKRLRHHVGEARNGGRAYRCNWLRSLSAAPTIESITLVRDRYAARAEQFAIALMRAGGEKLVNLTDGGEGTPGRILSAEGRAKLRAAQLGKRPSAETRAKMSVARRTRVTSDETRAKMSATRKGSKFPGRKLTAETRAKISKAHLGRKTTPEMRGHMRAAWLIRKSKIGLTNGGAP